jgi:ribosomal protein L11 methyltransferase
LRLRLRLRKDKILDLNLDLNLILSMMIPYQDFYIYEIDGEVRGSKNFFKEDFVGCWNEGEVSFLFFSRPRDEEVEAFIHRKGYPLLAKEVFNYKAWQAGEELKPFKVGNLVIGPPWEDCVIEKEEVLVHLDPCVVFGTGYHPTTRSCLKALWEIYQRERPEKVLDLGTGSGILALAAAKWGARRILAIDCNELAVETAYRNVLSNGESQRIEVKQGKAEDFIEEEADLVCANLHLQVIESLLMKEAFFRKRRFILSGLFVKDSEELERRLRQKSSRIDQRIQEKNWMTLIGMNGVIQVLQSY